jgi:asparagine synthetase B (glutamine-hydrolysing)
VVRRYWWPLHVEPLQADEGALRNEALERIDAAVVRGIAASHLSGKFGRANPAILLSGGVDSSLIAALASRHDVPLVSYTVAFNDTYGLNETAFASRVARSLRMPHRVVRVGVEDAARLMKGVLAEPYPRAAAAAITHAALIEAIAVHGHSYLLSGLGADECFGGYHKLLEHLAAQLHHMRKRGMNLVDLLNVPLTRLLRMREALFLGVAEFFTLRRMSQIAADDTLVREFPVADQSFYRGALQIKPDAHPLELMAAHEYQYRLSEQLLPALRGGLGATPTVYPFLDPTVYLWASALDPSHCYWHEDGAWWAKRLLREVAKQLLPAEIVMRKRQVLLAPVAHWLLTKSLRATIIEEIADSAFWKFGVLRRAGRDQLLTKLRRYQVLDPSSAWQEQLWVVLSLCAWVNRRTQL